MYVWMHLDTVRDIDTKPSQVGGGFSGGGRRLGGDPGVARGPEKFENRKISRGWGEGEREGRGGGGEGRGGGGEGRGKRPKQCRVPN